MNDASDLFQVSVDRDYGDDNGFMYATEAQALAKFDALVADLDTRRCFVYAPDGARIAEYAKS